jgi:NADPH:quinone reductase-like Zn-dependent oxidoreductase
VAGVNFLDVTHRDELVPALLLNGLDGEGAGLVKAIGKDVARWW